MRSMLRCTTCGRRRKPAHENFQSMETYDFAKRSYRWCKPQEPIVKPAGAPCLNCGAPEAHFVPPSLGEEGFFTCASPSTQTPPTPSPGMGSPSPGEGREEDAGSGQARGTAAVSEEEAEAAVADPVAIAASLLLVQGSEEADPAVGGLPSVRDGDGSEPGMAGPTAESVGDEVGRVSPGEGIACCPECGGFAEDYILDEVDIGVGIQANICNAPFHDAAKETRR